MANVFSGRGNLAAKPEFRTVEVDGGTRELAEMRIYFDRNVPDGNGGFTDRGGFWLTATLWGDRARRVAKLLDKGARVYCEGNLYRETWEKDGEERAEFRLRLDYIALDLSRVEQVSWSRGSRDETGEEADG